MANHQGFEKIEKVLGKSLKLWADETIFFLHSPKSFRLLEEWRIGEGGMDGCPSRGSIYITTAVSTN